MKQSHTSFASIEMNVTLGQVALLLLLQHGFTSSTIGRQSNLTLALPPYSDFASIKMNATLGQVALLLPLQHGIALSTNGRQSNPMLASLPPVHHTF